MTDLRSMVRNALASFVQQHGVIHNQTDCLRVIRDQSSLMYERQLVCDALDADPMEQLGDARIQIQRVKSLMDVTSCDRLVTCDGYSSIDAVVELRRDEHMNEAVESNVQLIFHYERRPSRPEDYILRGEEDQSSRGTHVWYWIDLSRDYGEKERLLTIEVWAIGEGPSTDAALMWEGSDDMEEDEANIDEERRRSRSVSLGFQDAKEDVAEEHQGNDANDRFSASVDPDIVSNFLNWTQLEGFDFGTSVYFLMTFPFYEHEWDMMGFVIEAVFGDAPEEEESDMMSEEEGNNMVSDESKEDLHHDL